MADDIKRKGGRKPTPSEAQDGTRSRMSEAEKRASIRRTQGKGLATYRTFWGLSQENLAEMLGVSRTTISGWESGTYAIPEDKMMLAAELLLVPAPALMTNSSPKERIQDLRVKAGGSLEIAQSVYRRLQQKKQKEAGSEEAPAGTETMQLTSAEREIIEMYRQLPWQLQKAARDALAYLRQSAAVGEVYIREAQEAAARMANEHMEDSDWPG